jgi:hypothetical protein
MVDRLNVVRNDLRTLSRDQLALRLVVLVMPLLATCATFAASSNWIVWFVLLMLVGAVECATHAESNLGVAVIVVLALHWIATVDDQTSPWTLVVALSIAAFHTAMAASGVSAPAARWPKRMRVRWLRRLGIVVILTVVAWCLEMLVAGTDQDGGAVVLAAALGALTVAALGLRARALHPSWPSRRNI